MCEVQTYEQAVAEHVADVLPPADGVPPGAAYLGRCMITAAVVLSKTIDYTLADNEGRTAIASLDFLADQVAKLADREELEGLNHA